MLRVGLIGADIQRSRTPALHMAEARAQGFELDYQLLDLTPRGLTAADLPQVLKGAEAAGFAGVNITHPCKQLVIPLLDHLSADAAALGAVNTVVFKDGERFGHNTDWSGFYHSFRRGLPDAPLGIVLQLGAGGAGAAVAHACLKLGVGQLVLHDLDRARADALASDLNHRAGREFALSVNDLSGAMAAADGVINTTPMGMEAHPGMALDPDLLNPRQWLAEIVYFPLETALLAAARARGCRTLDGGGMAVFQAVAAFELFTGRPADPDRMLAHFASMT